MTTATGADAAACKAATLTCVTGYSTNTEKSGCYSCSGSATVTNFVSCTVATNGGVTVPVCADGYYTYTTLCS